MNRKEQQTARQKYTLAYRRWRMYGESDDFLYVRDTSNEIMCAAEYAYEAKSHIVSGWHNRRRYYKWLDLCDRKATEGQWPF